MAHHLRCSLTSSFCFTFILSYTMTSRSTFLFACFTFKPFLHGNKQYQCFDWLPLLQTEHQMIQPQMLLLVTFLLFQPVAKPWSTPCELILIDFLASTPIHRAANFCTATNLVSYCCFSFFLSYTMTQVDQRGLLEVTVWANLLLLPNSCHRLHQCMRIQLSNN
jgi:hypothetical protein